MRRLRRTDVDRPRGISQAMLVVVVIAAFVAIGVSARLGLAPVRSYGVLFVAVFAWIGLYQPPGTSLKVLPLFVAAYVVPLLDADPPLKPAAVVIVGATCVFVAESIAREHRRNLEAGVRADRSAKAFRSVAAASASLQRLDPDAVLDAVVDGVMALGYDGANLVVTDDATDTFILVHPRGLSVDLGSERHPVSDGMTSIVRASRRPLVVEDYASWDHAVEFYRHSGVRTVIGVPVFTGDNFTGVLVASTRSSRPVPSADVDPIQSLADVAGAALANVERFQSEHLVAVEQTRAALTDELTGLPNRRHADEVLSRIATGTALVMIDVDHFRAVNERLGHAGGDMVLQRLARHLAAGLRDHDFVARFGGEELLLVLPRLDLDAATAVMDRLTSTWRRTNPGVTFSAGIARHVRGDVLTTLARADAALYLAKTAGRDRCFTEAALSSPAS